VMFFNAARISSSICSRSLCPRSTVQSPGTRTWSDTKRREPAWRVRSAWHWISFYNVGLCFIFISSAGSACPWSIQILTIVSWPDSIPAAEATVGSNRSHPVSATAQQARTIMVSYVGRKVMWL
jgi:hypothetical protein